jgi:hypothetical protein
MGFFSAGSTTMVSSVIYNMAGDIKDRANFLKTAALAGVIGETASIADTIRDAYKVGPGMTLRRFATWAKGHSGYEDTIGFTSGSISTGNKLDAYKLAQQIPNQGKTVALQTTDLDYADITWWAEQWILANKPRLIETDWHADYLNGYCYITYADRSVDSFVPANFDPEAKYIFATYTLMSAKSAQALVTGSVVQLGTAAFPDTTGWGLTSSTLTPVTLQLSAISVQGMNTTNVFEKTTYMGIDPAKPSQTYSTRQVMTQVEEVKANGATTTVNRWYRIDTQKVINTAVSGLNIFIYKQGGGNATLDAMFALPDDMGSFFPYIPVRIDNKMVSKTYKPDVYAMAKKGYKRATGGKFDELIDKINENASLKDIDYAYVVFGCSVNAEEVTAKKYIWAFFEKVMNSASFSPRQYQRFREQWVIAQASQDKYDAWVSAHGITQATPPAVTPFPALPVQFFEIKTSSNSNINFNMKISWNGIESASGAGIKDPTHKVGDMWWKVNGAETFTRTQRVSNLYGDGTVDGTVTFSKQVPNVTLYWQVDSNNWKSLTFYGLLHQNFIYDGKSVDTSITDAIKDTEESPFIIPLHEDIYKSLGMRDSTQLATACTYLYINCYQVVKKKWYQSWWFSVVMIIIIIVITVLTWGTGTGPTMSAYAAIGAAVGLTGTAAIIAGMVITMIAAMILSKILGVVAKAIFGEKIGAIVGAIATVVVMVYGGAALTGGNMAAATSQLTSPSTLLSLTSAVAQGVSEYLQIEAGDVIKQTSDMLESYNEKNAAVQDAYQALGMGNDAVFDPMQLTDVGKTSGLANYHYEPASSFLSRTLMTGSDVAELNTTLISEFTSLTLDLSQNLVT